MEAIQCAECGCWLDEDEQGEENMACSGASQTVQPVCNECASRIQAEDDAVEHAVERWKEEKYSGGEG